MIHPFKIIYTFRTFSVMLKVKAWKCSEKKKILIHHSIWVRNLNLTTCDVKNNLIFLCSTPISLVCPIFLKGPFRGILTKLSKTIHPDTKCLRVLFSKVYTRLASVLRGHTLKSCWLIIQMSHRILIIGLMAAFHASNRIVIVEENCIFHVC